MMYKFRTFDTFLKRFIEFSPNDLLAEPRFKVDLAVAEDKNWNLVYVNDIIKDVNYPEKGLVCFDMGNLWVDWELDYPYWKGSSPIWEEIEVVGNLHQNPELAREIMRERYEINE